MISCRTDTEAAAESNVERRSAGEITFFRYRFEVKRAAAQQIAYMGESQIVNIMFGRSMAIFAEEPE